MYIFMSTYIIAHTIAFCTSNSCKRAPVATKIARLVFHSLGMSHVTYINESCHIYPGVMSHMYESHTHTRREIARLVFTTLGISWPIYQCSNASHISASYVTCINASCRISMCHTHTHTHTHLPCK